MVSISQSFWQNFLKADIISNCTKNNSPEEVEKINVKVQRNCAKTYKLNHHFNSTCILTVLASVSYEFQNYFRHLVLLKMISFEKIFETVTQIILTVFVHRLLERLVDLL